MTPRTVIETEGVVIGVLPFEETHLVVRLMTRSHGLLSAMARHARRSKKRFGSHLDLFDRGVFRLATGRGGMLNLENFSSGPSFKALRNDLTKLAAASAVCECLSALVKEGGGEPASDFELLQESLAGIDKAGDAKETLRRAFLALQETLLRSGFSDRPRAGVPSAKNLFLLIREIEALSEREMKSRAALLAAIGWLKESEQSDTADD